MYNNSSKIKKKKKKSEKLKVLNPLSLGGIYMVDKKPIFLSAPRLQGLKGAYW